MDQDKLPPQDLEAEQAAIGSCLLSATAAAEIGSILVPQDFYREAHRVLFAAICAIRNAGHPVDLVTTAGELRRQGKLEEVGGGEYLTALINQVPTSAHGVRYARIVRRHSIARQAIRFAADIQDAAYAQSVDPVGLLGQSISQFRDLQDRCDVSNDAQLVADTSMADWYEIEQRRARTYEISPQRFGIPALDRITGGLEDAGFCIIKGDTNTGKSSLLRQIVLATCLELFGSDRDAVVLFAMEEKRSRWRQRSLGWLGQFDTHCFDNAIAWERHKQLHPTLEDDIQNAMLTFDQLPLWIAEGDQTIDSIEAICRRIQAKRTIRMVGIDYLQRLTKEDATYGTEEAAWRAISRRITRLRDDLGCPIVAPSQITKSADGGHITFGARAFQHDADLELEIHRSKDEDGRWQNACVLESGKTREITAWGKFPAYTHFATGLWTAQADEDGVVGVIGQARAVAK